MGPGATAPVAASECLEDSLCRASSAPALQPALELAGLLLWRQQAPQPLQQWAARAALRALREQGLRPWRIFFRHAFEFVVRPSDLAVQRFLESTQMEVMIFFFLPKSRPAGPGRLATVAAESADVCGVHCVGCCIQGGLYGS